MRLFHRCICKFMIISLITILLLGTAYATAAKGETTNRYNIVFVNDESGSMTTSDDQQFRYEAIRRFVALMAQEGNRIGSVSFNEKIIDTVSMTDITGFTDKTDFVDHISRFSPTGNKGMTNIGLALKTAVDLLDSERNMSLPSIIILLTDGDTQMPSEKETEISLEQKADAIDSARKSGYRIFSICLGGGSHEKELEQISSATGGEFEIVCKAEDLEEIQTMFYKIIFNALTDNTSEAIIGSDGKASKTFDVPGIGVEELNIIIEGEMSDCSLEDPNGQIYDSSILKPITIIGKDFRLIKVKDPTGGKWVATAYGKEGVKIKFKPLYNSSFYIDTNMQLLDEYKIGDVVTFNAVIGEKNKQITDIKRYDGFNGILHISFQGEEEHINMQLDSHGFVGKYQIENDGTYYAYITVSKDSLEAVSDEKYEFSVNNRTPIPPEKDLKIHANIWPFLGGRAVLDLSEAATDPDGDSLSYSIESSAFNSEDYSFVDNILSVQNFSIKRGSFTVRATDSRGAYCLFEVQISSTNIGLMAAILILCGSLLVLAIIIFVAWWLSQKLFMGTFEIENLSPPYESITHQKNRGQLKVRSLQIGSTGFDQSAHFQATGKNYVYFVSKHPVYNDYTGIKSKKIKIESSIDIRISPSDDYQQGIRVRFESMLNNNF